MPNEKEERKKYGLLSSKIAESDTQFLGHSLYGSGWSMHNKDTNQNTLSHLFCFQGEEDGQG
jgi:hypothetical protein